MFTPRIILVRPSHPGNIGSVARAMKTMGLEELYLVAPKKFPDSQAAALATHGENILEKAVVVNTIVEALEDVYYVFATCANAREYELPVFTPKEASEKLIKNDIRSAILFGPENHGLSNEDLAYVHGIIQIPTSSDYHSLNLACAVQVIVYEYHAAALENHRLASIPEMHHFYQHLEQLLINVKFLDPQKPRQLIPKLRNLFNRAQLKQNELSILEGILKAIDAKTDGLL